MTPMKAAIETSDTYCSVGYAPRSFWCYGQLPHRIRAGAGTMSGVKRSVGMTFSVAVALLIGATPAIPSAAPTLPSESADEMEFPLVIGTGQVSRPLAPAFRQPNKRT